MTCYIKYSVYELRHRAAHKLHHHIRMEHSMHGAALEDLNPCVQETSYRPVRGAVEVVQQFHTKAGDHRFYLSG